MSNSIPSEINIRLVTRGDDAGMCHTANVAIRDACEQGILRNVSVMVPAPSFEEAARLLADLQGIAIGLHVDLTAEWEHLRWGPVLPANEVPSLVDAQGHFFQTGQALHAHAPDLAHMKAEVRAQLAKARDTGLDIAYLDEHMGVGWIAGLDQWLSTYCEQEGLIYNRALLEGGKLRRLPRAGVGSKNPVAALITQLDAAKAGSYLLVGHPVYKTAEMQQAYLPEQAPGDETESRDWQRRMFMDRPILDYFRDHPVEAIRYTDI